MELTPAVAARLTAHLDQLRAERRDRLSALRLLDTRLAAGPRARRCRVLVRGLTARAHARDLVRQARATAAQSAALIRQDQ